MPNVRFWTTDEHGNDVLHTTVVLDKHLNTVEVIHHTSEEVRAQQRKRNTERVKRAIEDVCKQNPKAILQLYGES